MNDDFGQNLSHIDFAKTELVHFEKDFYIEHPDVTKRSDQDANAWRASKQIVIVGKDVPKPCMTFEEASMPEYILTEVLKQGFDKPTPIQSQGWPMALKGKNMVGIRLVRFICALRHLYFNAWIWEWNIIWFHFFQSCFSNISIPFSLELTTVYFCFLIKNINCYLIQCNWKWKNTSISFTSHDPH